MSVLRQDNVFIIKFSLSPRKFFGAKLTETAKIIIIIIIVRNDHKGFDFGSVRRMFDF